jgi:hypothetical protein
MSITSICLAPMAWMTPAYSEARNSSSSTPSFFFRYSPKPL